MSNTSHTKLVSSFYGGNLDTDSELRSIKSPNFRSALNIRNGKGIERGVVENALGNYETNFNNLPAGTNKCIGTLEDALENTIFYFIYNSNGDHQILRHYPTAGRTDILAQGSALNFNTNYYIHSAKLVDRKYLYWTDAFEDTNGLVGNEPRKLNVVKANNYQKQLQYEWHFALDDQFAYITLNTTSITVNATTINFTGLTNRASAITFVRNALIAAGYVVTTVNHTLVFSTGANNTAITTNASTTWARLVPYNFYTTGNISINHINWVKPQPQFAPTIDFISGTGGATDRKFTQYAVRYIFDDGEKSAWGSFSICPYNMITSGYKTLVDFYDDRLNSVDWLTIIKRVEIGVRYGITQPVKSVVILDTSEIGIQTGAKVITTPVVTSHHYTYVDTFVNNDIGSDDNTGDNETQVLKLYDNVPLLSQTINVIADENGSTMAVMGNNKRGYDNIKTDGTTFFDLGVTYPPFSATYPKVLYKTFGIYDWGVIYYDSFGRSSAVQKVNTLVFGEKATMQFYVGFQINHLAPSWATSYSIARTKDLKRESYTSYYATLNHSGSETLWTLSYNPIATDLTTSTGDITIYFDAQTRADLNLAQKGDKVFMFDTGVTVDTNVLGYKITAAGVFSFITVNVSATTGARTTVQMEVYKPLVNKDTFYYEIVRLPVLANNYHAGDYQNQTVSQPAIVKIQGGDTKYLTDSLTNTITNYFGQLEREYYYESEKIDNEDTGRPNIIDANAKQDWYKNEIRFSERYNLHSQYNGLSAFRSLDYIEVNYQFGSIQKLETALHSLLAICQYKIQPIYVNRDRMLDFQSNQSIGRTNRILNIAEEVVNNWGTRNPESVLNVDGRIYAFDSYNGVFWRFSQDGQTPLSDNGNSNLFRAVGRERMTTAKLTDKIICGYEKEHNTIYITFSTNGLRSAFTMGYEDASDTAGWKGNYSFIPEQYANVNGLFFTFLTGKLYQHGSDIFIRCNYFGMQYDSYIEFIVNDLPLTEKIPQNIAVLSDKLWWIDRIHTAPSNDFPTGQLSRIKANKFINYEGKWCADFLRDMNDNTSEFSSLSPLATKQATALLRGRYLRDTAFSIRLILNDPTVKSRLLAAETEFIISESTKTS